LLSHARNQPAYWQGTVAVHEHNAQADRSWSPAWTLVVASLALMMAFLDALVVTTALPASSASDDFGRGIPISGESGSRC
jgi:hypothetical protein